MKTLNSLVLNLVIFVFILNPILSGCASTRANQRAEAQVAEAPLGERLAAANADVVTAQNLWDAKLVTLTAKYNEWNQAKSDLRQTAADATDRPLKVNAERVAYQNLEKAGQVAFPAEWKNLQVLKARVVALQPVEESAEEAQPEQRESTICPWKTRMCYPAHFKAATQVKFWIDDWELAEVKKRLEDSEKPLAQANGDYVIPDRFLQNIQSIRSLDRLPAIGDEFPEPVIEQSANENTKLVVDDQRTDRPNREVRTEEVVARPVDRTQTGPRRSLLQSNEKAQLEAEWTRDNGDGTSDSVLLRGDMPLPETKVIVIEDDELKPWEIGLISLGVIGTVALIVLVPLAEAGYLSPSSPTFSF